jgi:shikimate kinase
MRVYLTGFMASGKSALGRALAAEMGLGFLDLDDTIEQNEGRSIPEIFRQGGEPAFRTAEKAALHATGGLRDYVIAVGGGTLVPDESMDWALSNGIVVFLDVSLEEIVRRLGRSRRRRPLVEAMRDSPGELEEYVSALLEERRPAYERAHLVVKLERTTVRRNARSLAQALRRYLAQRRTGSSN